MIVLGQKSHLQLLRLPLQRQHSSQLLLPLLPRLRHQLQHLHVSNKSALSQRVLPIWSCQDGDPARSGPDQLGGSPTIAPHHNLKYLKTWQGCRKLRQASRNSIWCVLSSPPNFSSLFESELCWIFVLIVLGFKPVCPNYTGMTAEWNQPVAAADPTAVAVAADP